MSFIQQQEEFDHVAGYSPSDKFAGYDRGDLDNDREAEQADLNEAFAAELGELQARYDTYVECARALGWSVVKSFDEWLDS